MRTYAFVKEGIVVKVAAIEPEDYHQHIIGHSHLVDVEDDVIRPLPGWLLTCSGLVPPPQANQTQLEMIEEQITRPAVEFGCRLKREMSAKLGAKNTVMGKTEEEVAALLPQLMPIGVLLESGALYTSRTMVQALISAFPEYTDELQYCISAINNFLGE